MSPRAWMSAIGLALLFWGAVFVVAVAIGSTPLSPSCDVAGAAPFTAPDNRCSPGQYRTLSHADVCDGRSPRPTLPARDRRRLLVNYGVPGWTGASGELDHRVPVFLGGATTTANLWPEVGRIPNPKDRLEAAVYRRVCFSDPAPMRVRTAVRIFLSDWRHAYRALVDAPVR